MGFSNTAGLELLGWFELLSKEALAEPNAGGGICAETLALKFCQGDVDCPRGFTCYENIFYSRDPPIEVNACFGECDYYVGQGYLP